MSTLWDLLLKPIRDIIIRPGPAKERPDSQPAQAGPARARPVSGTRRARPDARTSGRDKVPSKRKVPATGRPSRPKAQDTYDAIVRDMLARYQVRVRRWRKSMSGVAWLSEYRDGSKARFLESPRPKSPMSLAIFLHEIGHHHIGFGVYKPRCLEEYHAWKFAVEQMEALGVPVTDRVRRRMQRSLKYAVDKARRRGIKSVPEELRAFLA